MNQRSHSTYRSICAVFWKSARLRVSTATIVLASIFPQSSWALPFRANPSSFASYANSLQWEGTSARFSNLYNCNHNKYRTSNTDSERAKYAREQSDDWYRLALGERDVEKRREAYAQKTKWLELWSKYSEEDGTAHESYNCNGYVTLQDPKGTRTCDATLAWSSDSRQVVYRANQCRWR